MFEAKIIKKKKYKSILAQHHSQAFVGREHVCVALPTNRAGVKHLFPTAHGEGHLSV